MRTGTFTSPNEIEPDQIARGGIRGLLALVGAGARARVEICHSGLRRSRVLAKRSRLTGGVKLGRPHRGRSPMKGRSKLGVAAGCALATALAASLALGLPGTARKAGAASASCYLGHGIQHVIYLQFDNTHFRRDNPNVPSDLEQMPHLLDFLKSNGTLFTNDHTVLISHTANGILSSLTGLYPDRNGMTVGNSYGFFGNDGATHFSSSFKYWTDPVDATFDPKPNMVTLGGKNTPAPWVQFTRAGCDVGGVGTANIELENTATNASGDMTKVFGTNSPEWNEAVANPALAQTDFVGIAIHCGNATN